MNITFNLKEAVVYLLSGKLMNMKDKLKWSYLEMTQGEIQAVLKSTENEHFQINLNFDKLENELAKDFMDEQSYQRVEIYKNLIINYFESLDFFKAVETKLYEESLDFFAGLEKSILQDNLVSEKLQKLNRLKLINS